MESNAWLSIDEAAKYLKTDRVEIEEMMKRKLIPYALLPISKNPLFSTDRLDRWLRDQEVVTQDGSRSPEVTRETLTNMVMERIHTRAVSRSRYINLYAGTRVYAQLHEPSERKSAVYDGICLAIPEATSYGDTPEVEFLQPIDIRDLAGYWKANKDWLDGNGQRFKNHKAMAYHIPLRLGTEPGHQGWSEVDALLKHALRKLAESGNPTD